MIVHQAYRYELKPNNKQRTLFLMYAGTRRFVYNWGLTYRIEEFKRTGTGLDRAEFGRRFLHLKRVEQPWLYEVSSQIELEALRDLDQAFKNFFRRCKKGGKPGFPKFKKKGVRDSFRFPNNSFKVFDTYVQFSMIGKVRVKERTDKLQGRILNATVRREVDRWFVSFNVEQNRPDPKLIKGDVVGIDLGISCFAVLSDGTRIEKPAHLEQSLRLLKRRQQALSRKKKGSNNWCKAKLAVAKIYMRIRNQRRDFLHKLSSLLAKAKQEIVIEGLYVAGMVQNRCLSRRISDASWGMFRVMLEYKCNWYGSKLTVAPRFFPSTKRCSRCGNVKKQMDLGERVYQCSNCDLVLDRDLNAAINLAESFSVTACGEDVSRNLSHIDCATSVKQEANTSVVVGEGKFREAGE